MGAPRRIASRRLHRRLIAGAVLLAVAHVAGAAGAGPAEESPPARPRIALVLGGGGAKGAAHIGVVKVLEELRVPVDCIAGTSMGAIVGAAYATGMSARQLEQTITAVNWKEILASAPRQQYSVHRKTLDFIFTLGFEVGVKNGAITPPTGLVPTHQIEAVLRRITANAAQVSNFDHLPIPYRAVATDLESGAMVVFDHGELAVAMRASMAVPGVFPPVEYNGRLLVDGMLVRNLPVDVARRMCGDVVIAVPVANPAATRDALGTLVGVAGQAMNIAIDANEKAQRATLTPRDVEIPVVLENVTSADFASVPEAIPIGEAAARKAAAALSRYSLSPQEYAEWRSHLRKLAAVPEVKIDEVRLAGFETTNPEVMRTFLHVKPGDTYDPKEADADTTRLVARGDFTSVSYRLSTENGRHILTYTAVEKPWGPNYLLFDLNLSSDMKGDTAWGLRADYEKRWLNSLGGELRTSLQVGRPNLFSAEFYQPVDKTQRLFIAPSVFGIQTLGYLYNGEGARLAQLDTRRYGGRLEGGAAFASWGELRLGLLRGSVDTGSRVGSQDIPDLGSHELGGSTVRFIADTLDKRLFATEGTYATFNGYVSQTGLGAEQGYKLVAFGVQKVIAVNRNVFTFRVLGGSDMGSDAPLYDQFKHGGLFDFSGYRLNELVGRKYVLAGTQYRRRIADLNETVGTGVYGGATLEAGNVYQRFDGTPARGALLGGSLFVAIDSKLGPVYLAYGQSEGGRRALYFYLGSSLEAF